MSRRRIGFMLIGAGIVLALLVGVLVNIQGSEAEALREAQPKHWAVAAAVDIPERSIIGPEQVTIIRVPENAITPGAAFFLPEPDASDDQIARGQRAALDKVIKQFTPQRIFKNEVINLQRLGQEAAKTSPAFEIPQGKVWYHFAASQNMLIASLDFVRPGDFIDVYVSVQEVPPGALTGAPTGAPTGGTVAGPGDELRRLYTRRILQNIKVLNVGPFPRGTPATAATRILTFEVTPEEALMLKWLKDSPVAANLEFVVRSPLDTQPYRDNTMDFESVARRTGIGTGRP